LRSRTAYGLRGLQEGERASGNDDDCTSACRASAADSSLACLTTKPRNVEAIELIGKGTSGGRDRVVGGLNDNPRAPDRRARRSTWPSDDGSLPGS
jgi:hypothetical protein